MERKHKIWLAVLLILLIAAIAGVVYLNSERTQSDAQLASANAMLEEERGKYLTLEEALAGLDIREYNVLHGNFVNQRENAPQTFLIQREESLRDC